MSKILVISTSMRVSSNFDMMADAFIEGATKKGNECTKIILKDKEMNPCRGCLSCQTTGVCVHNDDISEIVDQMRNADGICFATPVYFYSLPGQFKILLDRTNPIFSRDYQFRSIYLLLSCADLSPLATEHAIGSVKGWIRCFPKAELKGTAKGTGNEKPGSALSDNLSCQKAYELGLKSI